MSFTAQLKGAEGQYKLVSKVVRSICESNSLNFETVWATISNRECEYFDRHFKRHKRRNDPFRQVKKPRTAFSFFTQANRNDIQTKHPNLSFGEVSKLVGEQWKNLDEKARAKYIQLETEDKARYTVARKEVMEAMAAAVPVEPATEPVVAASVPAPKKTKAVKQAAASAPAATTEASVASAPAAVVSATTEVSATKSKKTKQTAPTATAETAPAVVAATSAAPKKEKKAKQAVAPVAVAADASATVAATTAEAPAKKEKKSKLAQASASKQ
jgi:hypothetical protein